RLLLRVSYVIGRHDLFRELGNDDAFVSTCFEVTDQSVFDVLQIPQIHAHAKSIKRGAARALVLNERLVRVGPCLAKQFQSDRRVNESERTAQQNCVVTCGSRANTKQHTTDQIQQLNQFRIWNPSCLDKLCRKFVQTWISNLV